jgi:hypothetical protein
LRTVRNITVAVSEDLYRQTRILAAEYDTTVTAIVAYLLERLPSALKRAGYPAGGPKSARSAPPAPQTAPSPATASANAPSPSPVDLPAPSPMEIAVSPSTAPNPNLNHPVS